MINGTLATQTVEEFDKRHGKDRIQILGHWYYANGAVRDAGNPDFVTCHEPSNNLFARQQNIVTYHEEIYRLEHDKARHFRTALHDRQARAEQNPHSFYISPPTKDEVNRLAAMVENLKPLHKNLEDARAELAKLDPRNAPEAVAIREHDQRRVEEGRSLLDAIKF